MSFPILISILFELLEKGRLTAPYLAQKYGVSTRTVYRYVDKLVPHLPLLVQRGRKGGIFLSDSYKLPFGYLRQEEYEATLQGLDLAYAASPEERFLSARRKLTAQAKEERKSAIYAQAEEILLLPDGEKNEDFERLRIIQESVKERRTLRILFEKKESAVEPHLFLYRRGEWFLFGFCHARRSFFPFPVANIQGVFQTKERFRPRKLPDFEATMSALKEISSPF